MKNWIDAIATVGIGGAFILLLSMLNTKLDVLKAMNQSQTAMIATQYQTLKGLLQKEEGKAPPTVFKNVEIRGVWKDSAVPMEESKELEYFTEPVTEEMRMTNKMGFEQIKKSAEMQNHKDMWTNVLERVEDAKVTVNEDYPDKALVDAVKAWGGTAEVWVSRRVKIPTNFTETNQVKNVTPPEPPCCK